MESGSPAPFVIAVMEWIPPPARRAEAFSFEVCRIFISRRPSHGRSGVVLGQGLAAHFKSPQVRSSRHVGLLELTHVQGAVHLSLGAHFNCFVVLLPMQNLTGY